MHLDPTTNSMAIAGLLASYPMLEVNYLRSVAFLVRDVSRVNRNSEASNVGLYNVYIYIWISCTIYWLQCVYIYIYYLFIWASMSIHCSPPSCIRMVGSLYYQLFDIATIKSANPFLHVLLEIAQVVKNHDWTRSALRRWGAVELHLTHHCHGSAYSRGCVDLFIWLLSFWQSVGMWEVRSFFLCPSSFHSWDFPFVFCPEPHRNSLNEVRQWQCSLVGHNSFFMGTRRPKLPTAEWGVRPQQPIGLAVQLNTCFFLSSQGGLLLHAAACWYF